MKRRELLLGLGALLSAQAGRAQGIGPLSILRPGKAAGAPGMGGGGSGGGGPFAPSSRVLRVACVGDSITQGVRLRASNNTYPQQLERIVTQAEQGRQVTRLWLTTNLGEGTQTSAQIAARWVNSIRQGGYSWVVLLAGHYDITTTTLSGAQIWETQRTMMEDALDLGMRVVTVAPLPFKPDTYDPARPQDFSWTAQRQARLEAFHAAWASWVPPGKWGARVRRVDGYTIFGKPGAPAVFSPSYAEPLDYPHLNLAGVTRLASEVSSMLLMP